MGQVTGKSSDPTVVSITRNGSGPVKSQATFQIKALKTGKATITVTASGITQTMDIVVNVQTLKAQDVEIVGYMHGNTPWSKDDVLPPTLYSALWQEKGHSYWKLENVVPSGKPLADFEVLAFPTTDKVAYDPKTGQIVVTYGQAVKDHSITVRDKESTFAETLNYQVVPKTPMDHLFIGDGLGGEYDPSKSVLVNSELEFDIVDADNHILSPKAYDALGFELLPVAPTTDVDKVVRFTDGHDKLRVFGDGKFKVHVIEYDGKTLDSPIITVGNGGVTTPPLTALNIRLNSSRIPLNKHDTRFALRGTPSAAQLGTVTWTVGDPSILKVDPDGTIHPLKAGRTTVKATAKGITSNTNTVIIEAVDIAPTAIRLEPPEDVMLKVNETRQVTFVPSPANATIKGLVWASTDENVAFADNKGVIHAVSVGEVYISARVGSMTTNTVRVVVQADNALTDFLLEGNFKVPYSKITSIDVVPIPASAPLPSDRKVTSADKSIVETQGVWGTNLIGRGLGQTTLTVSSASAGVTSSRTFTVECVPLSLYMTSAIARKLAVFSGEDGSGTVKVGRNVPKGVKVSFSKTTGLSNGEQINVILDTTSANYVFRGGSTQLTYAVTVGKLTAPVSTVALDRITLSQSKTIVGGKVTATAFGTDGKAMTGVTWSVSNSQLASINQTTQQVTALAAGTVQVRATQESPTRITKELPLVITAPKPAGGLQGHIPDTEIIGEVTANMAFEDYGDSAEALANSVTGTVNKVQVDDILCTHSTSKPQYNEFQVMFKQSPNLMDIIAMEIDGELFALENGGDGKTYNLDAKLVPAVWEKLKTAAGGDMSNESFDVVLKFGDDEPQYIL